MQARLSHRQGPGVLPPRATTDAHSTTTETDLGLSVGKKYLLGSKSKARAPKKTVRDIESIDACKRITDRSMKCDVMSGSRSKQMKIFSP